MPNRRIPVLPVMPAEPPRASCHTSYVSPFPGFNTSIHFLDYFIARSLIPPSLLKTLIPLHIFPYLLFDFPSLPSKRVEKDLHRFVDICLFVDICPFCWFLADFIDTFLGGEIFPKCRPYHLLNEVSNFRLGKFAKVEPFCELYVADFDINTRNSLDISGSNETMQKVLASLIWRIF